MENIEITQVPPDVDELTDEEDFDDETIGDDCRDPSFLPLEVRDTVELYQYIEDRRPTTQEEV